MYTGSGVHCSEEHCSGVHCSGHREPRGEFVYWKKKSNDLFWIVKLTAGLSLFLRGDKEFTLEARNTGILGCEIKQITLMVIL